MPRQTIAAIALATSALALSAPAHGQDAYYQDGTAYKYDTSHAQDGAYYEDDQYDYTAQRAAWLDECRRRVRRDGSGAVIGGLAGAAIGGVIGNRVAGRGDRVLGTVVGAGVGGVAGAAVGSAVDNRNARDECEAYLLDYEARYRAQQDYYAQGHDGYYRAHHGQAVGYTYAVPMMVVRVPVRREGEVECTETVEEYVTYETVYETEVVETVVETAPAAPARRAAPAKTVKYVKQ